jgi:hypothetical protein
MNQFHIKQIGFPVVYKSAMATAPTTADQESVKLISGGLRMCQKTPESGSLFELPCIFMVFKHSMFHAWWLPFLLWDKTW